MVMFLTRRRWGQKVVRFLWDSAGQSKIDFILLSTRVTYEEKVKLKGKKNVMKLFLIVMLAKGTVRIAYENKQKKEYKFNLWN